MFTENKQNNVFIGATFRVFISYSLYRLSRGNYELCSVLESKVLHVPLKTRGTLHKRFQQ